eukprot:CAMPEP_0182486206 /NCGR_PEP_ID=MMETSP1319-20130603/46642_1 /TAXON_ID=172717 /ORGANISM="Bolidomonas pacifica, Strain RCC208" /LENGTH=100 /DNA_ID=CAMNT_0024688271 /DNA_START=1 /DNA_END=300 /DNA_ORIENTATION=-
MVGAPGLNPSTVNAYATERMPAVGRDVITVLIPYGVEAGEAVGLEGGRGAAGLDVHLSVLRSLPVRVGYVFVKHEDAAKSCVAKALKKGKVTREGVLRAV